MCRGGIYIPNIIRRLVCSLWLKSHSLRARRLEVALKKVKLLLLVVVGERGLSTLECGALAGCGTGDGSDWCNGASGAYEMLVLSCKQEVRSTNRWQRQWWHQC